VEIWGGVAAETRRISFWGLPSANFARPHLHALELQLLGLAHDIDDVLVGEVKLVGVDVHEDGAERGQGGVVDLDGSVAPPGRRGLHSHHFSPQCQHFWGICLPRAVLRCPFWGFGCPLWGGQMPK